MGMIKLFCSTSPEAPAPNPDPTRWRLIRHIDYGKIVLVEIKYLDCTNYNGCKILVLRGVKILELIKYQMKLDPHFQSDEIVIARFAPTESGWQHAQYFITGIL